ncbi:MAG: type II toxin-antitoxin system Phd/YefM family antitoxin [Tepidiformaceae bacterium]
MREIGAAEFKAKCLEILDHVDPDGIVITKRGKPVARLMPIENDPRRWIGSLRGKVRVDPEDDLFSTGIRWEAEDGLIDGSPADEPGD